jgi:hypothetical protein
MKEERKFPPVPSLLECADALRDNFVNMMKANQPLLEAGDTVHRSLDRLLSEQVAVDPADGGAFTAAIMGVVSRFCWVNAIFLAGGGEAAGAMGAARRSVELCCYAAKVIKNPDRAKDWITSCTDTAARSRFLGQCKIPTAFNGKDYKFLRPMLALYDMASDLGIHANFESIAHAWEGECDGRVYLRHISEPGDSLSNAVDVVVVGYWLYTALAEILAPCIKDRDAQKAEQASLEKTVKRLCDSFSRFQVQNKTLPSPFILSVVSGDKQPWTKLYQEFLKRSQPKRRECPECGHKF